ncbi:MAG TPA: DUF3574 domain-containing protein [Rhizomicrobium sp.]|nr:DUF3574 domain-containing protein [Rhizomicrobium sp.]
MILGVLLAASVASCPLPAEQKMVEAQLFFGRDIADSAPVSDAQWSDFEAGVIARNFPDGFTVSDGDGEWRDPKSLKVVHEPSKILLVAAKPSPALKEKLEAVIDAYKTRFHQQSVGVITREVCAAF